MKKAVAILVCLSLIVQLVAHHVVVGLFNLNREYIAKSLCENRSKPSKKCNGKCYLKKQLKKVDDTEHGSSTGSTLKIEKTEVVCLVPATFQFTPGCLEEDEPVRNPVSADFIEQGRLHSIFHPPSARC
ncbi:MAG: hypothetical protein KF744_11685 [Taibaiella sp.]|nr:hypothetical protein [Taibaiella sp.]